MSIAVSQIYYPEGDKFFRTEQVGGVSVRVFDEQFWLSTDGGLETGGNGLSVSIEGNDGSRHFATTCDLMIFFTQLEQSLFALASLELDDQLDALSEAEADAERAKYLEHVKSSYPSKFSELARITGRIHEMLREKMVTVGH
ncbi:hypothetical protein [Parasphingorhabdus halotolerans]|uniref:Uncharacterized protein n=1 Tax=Parasphingorhabdus halotolerans TaxID=2725558 RepID=A0A6H2DKV3_9SPHN|nr:hypothetical protein [Parasphingorhabdus halotolerans]QJB68286.1 hypothetical protein HF685_02355 [Parasphingorhabdus halotolerans]